MPSPTRGRRFNVTEERSEEMELYDRAGNQVVYSCVICGADLVVSRAPVEQCIACKEGVRHVHLRCEKCSPPGWWGVVRVAEKGVA